MSEIQPEKLDRKAEYEKAKAEKAAQKAKEKADKEARKAQAKSEKGLDSKESEKNSNEKIEKGRRFSRGNDGERAFAGSLGLENRREIPVSTYDLLNNRFGDSNRARYVLILLYVIALAIYAFILFTGFATRIAINDVDKEMKILSENKTKLLQQFGSSTGLKGVSETDLIDRAKVVSDATKSLVAKQADIGTIVNEIKGKDIPGVIVTSIDITRADFKLSPDDPKHKDAKFMSTQASSYIVTVIGTGKDFPSVVSWSDSIRSIPVLYNVSFARNGLKITLTASVKNSTPPGGVTLLSSFGIGSDNSIAPATPTQSPSLNSGAGNQTPATKPGSTALTNATASNKPSANTAPNPGPSKGSK